MRVWFRAAFKVAWQLTKQTWKEYDEDHGPRIGAALAYYTIFSMAPLLVIAAAVAGLVFGPEAAQAGVSRELQSLVGTTGARAIEDALASSQGKTGGVVATIIGTVTLLLGATSVFMQLQGALNQIWDAPPPPATRGWLRTLRSRGLSFGMVLVIGFLLMVSLVVSALISGVGDRLAGWIEIPGWALQGINLGVSVVVVTGLFALLYKLLPDVHIPWADVRVGAFVTACLFTFGKLLIGLYLGNSSVASSYGAAGSLAVVLVWVYYAAQLILIGAEFTQVYSKWRVQPR